MVLDIDDEQIRMRRVVKNVRENRSIRTVYFRDDESNSFRPGQFVMIWEPGYDEFPMSLSDQRDGLCSVTVKGWGPGSNELLKAKRGDVIGVRGPYGRPFTVERCNALLVGGGTGLAPLLPLARALVREGSRVTVIIGGRSKSDLLFDKLMQRVVKRKNLFFTTDDGSYGFKGFATDIAESLVKERRITHIYTCGPEAMMRKLYEIASRLGLKFEAGLERSMKCAIGICGSCTVGKYLLCRDGAVLDRTMLRESLDEFGLLQRDPSGKYVKVPMRVS